MSRDLARSLTNTTGGLSMLYCKQCRKECPHRQGICSSGHRYEVPTRDWPKPSKVVRFRRPRK